MKTLAVILLSVALNVALLYLNARIAFSPPPPKAAAPIVNRVVTNTVWRLQRAAAPAPPPATNPPPTISFHWSQIEAPEYPAYIANLRKFGCPERTVQNIIIADVSKSFETRAVDLAAADPDPFWSSGSTLLTRQRERTARQRALDQERLQLLGQLLGLDPFTDPRLTNRDGHELLGGHRLQSACFCSHLTPAKRAALEQLLVSHQSRNDFFQTSSRAAGFGNDAELARRLSEDTDAELRKLLTPDERAEIAARMIAPELRHAGVNLTAAELRSLALIQSRNTKFFAFDPDPVDPAGPPASSEQEIQKLLGPQRFADFQRAQDERFADLLEFTSENGLPKPNAIRAYDIRAAAERAAAEINAEETLTPAEAARLLRELQTTTTAKLKLELSPALAEKYFEEHSSWLQNLSRPQRKNSPKPAAP